MADQSKIQSIVQNLQGTHTQGQSNVPSAAQTGNPNSVYNWTTYLPSVDNSGGRPAVNFDLLTSQAPASSPGYTPPFTADPYAAMVMSSMPRASENPVIANLLAGFRGNGRPPGTPGVTPPGGPAGPSTPIGTQPGTGPGPDTTWSGAGTGKPIGPISGPIENDPHNWQGNYNNAQPNTNLNQSGLGRQQALDWLRTDYGIKDPQAAMSAFGPGNQAVAGLGQRIGTWLNGLGVDLGHEARTFMQSITGQNGIGSLISSLAGILQPGAGALLDPILNKLPAGQRQEFESFINQEARDALDRTLAGMNQQQQEDARALLLASLREGAGGNQGGNRLLEAYNNTEQMSDSEWRRTQESMAWNNFWQGRPEQFLDTGGTRQHRLGIPGTSNVDSFLNDMARRNLAISEWFQNMRGFQEK